jgi:hypothetical protein
MAPIKSGLVDLITTDKELQDAMISDYPGLIKEGQYHVESNRGTKVYMFLNLEKGTLLEFLKSHKNCEYIIRKSSDGAHVVINKVKIYPSKYQGGPTYI